MSNSLIYHQHPPTLTVDCMTFPPWGACSNSLIFHQQPSILDGGLSAHFIIFIFLMLLALFFWWCWGVNPGFQDLHWLDCIFSKAQCLLMISLQHQLSKSLLLNNLSGSGVVWHTPLIKARGMQRQVDLFQLEACLYIQTEFQNSQGNT